MSSLEPREGLGLIDWRQQSLFFFDRSKMTNLVDGILEATTLTDSSKAQYLEKLSTVTKLTKQPLEWVLDHPDEVQAVIAQHYTSPLTQRSIIAAIKAVFHYNDDIKASKQAQYNKFTEFQSSASLEISNRYMAAEPSEKERRNWVPWPEVVAKEQQLAAREYASPDHLLLAMYCLIEPLRQDYGALRIMVDRMPAADAVGNYLAIARDGSWGKLILTEYKTAKKYGTYTRDLPPSLLRIIKASLIANPRAYLFMDERGKPYKLTNSFTQYSNRTLKRIFGKACTVSTMRHSHISNIDFNASTPGDLFRKSKHMAHSIATQQLYRRTVEPAHVLHQTQPVPQPLINAITHGPNGERFIEMSA